MAIHPPSFIPLDGPVSPANLDIILAQGWYRMRQHVFTTRELEFEDGTSVPVSWLRICTGAEYTLPHRFTRLAARCRQFTCKLIPWRVSLEAEALFSRYRGSISFDTVPTVASVLLDSRRANFFPTRMWELRDGNRLIGVSYFDEGRTSAAGILSFFDPEYRACSPGLWLYLQSVRHCMETGREYFYPGYIAIGWTKFDYKLLAGEGYAEVWDEALASWHPYAASVHAGWTALKAVVKE